ncbi:hypothetical protein TEA_001143 [Camellia sinensis var. sinensis]|uniref:Uncharacterized protein n=1 Tax=Camellia sinensis var. sinensis TaxID=542762 RepID=A0A4S4DB18_CAMSN|nr:hypothetical protein TEA_001143 [Camellia sinensis var. sinensis]
MGSGISCSCAGKVGKMQASLGFSAHGVPYDLSLEGSSEPWAVAFLARVQAKWERCKQVWVDFEVDGDVNGEVVGNSVDVEGSAGDENNEHDKIRELSQQLAIEKKRAATYKRHLEMVFEHIEEHNQSLSKKIEDIVDSVREIESKEKQSRR